jgi:hypothetical protein
MEPHGDQRTGASVFLGSSLLQLLTQIKTVLLFYDQAIVVPVDVGMTHLNAEKIDHYKRTGEDVFSVFYDGTDLGRSSLEHLEVLNVDDFHHAWAACEVLDIDINLEIVRTAAHDDEIIDQAQFDEQDSREVDPPEEEIARRMMDAVGDWHVTLYKEVLKKSLPRGSELIYGTQEHLWMANATLERVLHDSAESVGRADFILGGRLIEMIANHYVPDLTHVHSTDIVSYRQRHVDSLKSFNTEKLRRLRQIRKDPASTSEVVIEFEEFMSQKCHDLQADIASLKSKKKMSWLSAIGQAAVLNAIGLTLANGMQVLASTSVAAFLAAIAVAQKNLSAEQTALLQKSAAGYFFSMNSELKQRMDSHPA